MKMNNSSEVSVCNLSNGIITNTGYYNTAWKSFRFIVRWPVVAIKKDGNLDNCDYCVNIRKQEFDSYEEAKRHKNFLISHLNEIRSTILPSEIIIEIIEC